MAVAGCGVTPATVVDVGANVGQFSRASLGRWPASRIIAFEPLPSAAVPLRRMLMAMGDRHAVHQVALGSSEGESVFHRHHYSLSSSVLPVAEPSRHRYSWADEAESIKVPMARLDDELVDVALDRPVLVKIDVQGFEMEVLNGAEGVLQEADCLVVEHAFDEFYEGQSRAAEVMKHLIRTGWGFNRVVDVRRERGVIVEADFVYLRQRVNTEDEQ
jgi:FkbM family methyltransferase